LRALSDWLHELLGQRPKVNVVFLVKRVATQAVLLDVVGTAEAGGEGIVWRLTRTWCHATTLHVLESQL